MAITTIIESKTATIANAATTSGVVDLGATAVCGVSMPAAFTGTALAFHVSSTTGGTYAALRDSTGAPYSLTVTAGGRYYVDPVITAGWPFLKLVADTQSQESIVTLLCRPV